MRLTIKLKLGLAFVAVIALSAVMAVLEVNSLSALNTTMEEVLQGPVQRAQWEEQLHRMLLGIVGAEKNLVMAETPQQIDAYSQEAQQQREAFIGVSDSSMPSAASRDASASTCCARGSSATPRYRSASAT